MAADGKPVLWHIRISHYSEKVRWALDHKDIEHERRAPTPGAHMAVALWLTRGAGKTFPILQLDGRTIADSTEIIAALEELKPEPALYPQDPDERRRALELEDFFDEELAPHTRRLAFHEAIKDQELVAETVSRDLPERLQRIGVVRAGAGRFGALFAKARYSVQDEQGAEEAREKILIALDRLEDELGDGDYLVGDSFTVADLTAAALFYPLVRPPEGPAAGATPAALEAFRAPLEDRRGYRWVEEIFAGHRRRAARTPRQVA